jgi:uncharacterized membrane protein
VLVERRAGCGRGARVSSRLRQAVIALAGLLGLAVSAYLTAAHASPAALACGTGGAVNCERVLSSDFAVIAGTPLPTAAAGVAWFLASVALALARLAWPGAPLLARLQLLWAGTGLAVVIGLVFVEIVLLGVVCAWCTAAHALVLVTFLAAVTEVEAWSGEAGRAAG